MQKPQPKTNKNFFKCYDYDDDEPEYMKLKKHPEKVSYHY